MLSRQFVVLTSTLLLTTAAFAGPRIHRGPTSPKLFKSRTAAAPKPRAGVDPERRTQIETAARG